MTVAIALRCGPLRARQRCPTRLVRRSPSPRYSSDFSQLRERLLSRQLPYGGDFVTPKETSILRRTLQGFLPASTDGIESKTHKPLHDGILGPSHHLVYFPIVAATSLLLPDGTDPGHSPGPPFTRRMWAGGSMEFLHDIPMNGNSFHCAEMIDNVQVRGKEGNEKIYVKVQRGVYAGKYPGELAQGQREGTREKRQSRPHTKVRIKEDQTFVFMHGNGQEGSPAAGKPSIKVFRPAHTADFSHTMVPTRELLFRFSALTFNAHAIHLDKQYCREIEGHRNLLVQGSLTVILMIEVLQCHLRALADGTPTDGHEPWLEKPSHRIEFISYRNLAPLYAEEEMKICVKGNGKERFGTGYTIWDVWIEGSDGGIAAKGNVRTFNKVAVATKIRSISTSGPVQQEAGVEEESIPIENIAFQNESRATDVTESKEDVSTEETSELEAEKSTETDSAPHDPREQQPSGS